MGKKYILLSLILAITFPVCAQKYQKLGWLSGNWKFAVGDNKEWAREDFNDSDWELVKVPSSWEDQGFNGYDGFAWYRKEISISSDYKGKDLYLNLGYIDDCDEVYFNGKLIGFTGSMPPKYTTGYNMYRKYYVPRELINFDKLNTIAVRVYDFHMVGGITAGEVNLSVSDNSLPTIINLQGLWRFTPRDNNEFMKPDYPVNNWNMVTVPKLWEDQGYPNYDGFAWYNRKFYVSGNYENERLVVVLGKIDDFEEVYLNGEYIGPLKSIAEARRGETRYNQFRAYFIPGKMLKPNQTNVISVRVLDIGGGGGIFEGPVGISRQSEYVQYWKNKR